MTSLLALVTLSLIALPATAEPNATKAGLSPAERLEVDLAVELPVLTAGLLLWSVPLLIDGELPRGQAGSYDRERVNAIDRFAIDLEVPGARLTSDILAGVIPAATISASLIELEDGGWGEVLDDLVIMTEAMALTGITNQVVRHAFVRPRPFMYRDDGADQSLGGGEDLNSFFSGHTATAFAGATAQLAKPPHRR